MTLNLENQNESEPSFWNVPFFPEIFSNSEYNFFHNDFLFSLNINNSLSSYISGDTNDIFPQNPLTINSILFQTEPRNIFAVKKKVRPGRKKKENREKIHLNTDLDNLLARIQVHFLSFIVNISNDALITEFGEDTEYKFKNIDYKIKFNISYSSFIKFKNSSIKDVLKLRISPKYKHFDPKINSQILEEVHLKSEWLNKFFNMNYLEMFKEYYYQEKQITEINYEGNIIKFNKNNKTETFYDLLNKYKDLKSDLINTVNSVYLNLDNKKNKGKFIATKNADLLSK